MLIKLNEKEIEKLCLDRIDSLIESNQKIASFFFNWESGELSFSCDVIEDRGFDDDIPF